MARKIRGLCESEVIKSREKYGDNSLKEEKRTGLLLRFLRGLFDPIIRVLIIAVALEIVFSFGNCNWFEVGGILFAVVVATLVSAISESGSEKAFFKMQAESSERIARVFRDGELKSIPECDIVVGDTVCLGAGERVPADGVMLSGVLSVDQSAINGESVEVVKQRDNSKGGLDSSGEIFRGSLVVSGEGIFEVNKVGEQTHYGKVAKELQADTRKSPLTLRLSSLASSISRLGYIMAFIVGFTYLVFALGVDFSFDFARISEAVRDIPFMVSTLSHAITLMITVIVVAVPEGLPMMITVVLSSNMKRMQRDGVMVKKLVGIETAGSMNILFTDKTGTLTEGKSRVYRVALYDKSYKSEAQLRQAREVYRLLSLSAKLSVDISGGGLMNSTDRALCDFFSTSEETAAVVSRLAFSSERKYSSVTLKEGKTLLRGAPEILLDNVSFGYHSDGERRPINTNKVMREYKESAGRGERVIAIVELDEVKREKTFIALVIMKDSLRLGVSDAVDKITHAGVQVVMITGDGEPTARAIAEECGILRYGNSDSVITASQLDKMTDEEIKAKIRNIRVVARALPKDKLRLVRICQEMNLVVGMTGDGINDAPSLKLADIGFAMGSGTEIAKSAGDIVILDDSFTSIVNTVLYGRTIFKSIRKFISFQLMMNLTACGVSLLGQFLGIESPITIIQMLWINIIMDTLGGLAFAGEAPNDYYMLERPKKREEKILSRDMLHQIIFTGGYTLLLCIAFLSLGFFKSLFRYDANDAYFLTGFYALFVFSGIFNCINARSERMSLLSGISKNKPFLLIMLLISAIQIAMIYFGGEIFRCAPLDFRELLSVILIAFSVIPFDIIRRIIKKLG